MAMYVSLAFCLMTTSTENISRTLLSILHFANTNPIIRITLMVKTINGTIKLCENLTNILFYSLQVFIVFIHTQYVT